MQYQIVEREKNVALLLLKNFVCYCKINNKNKTESVKGSSISY